MWLNVGLIFLGGGLGSVARYLVGSSVAGFAPKWPAGTLIANVLATLVLALLAVTIAKETTQNHWLRWLGMVGFCGGFSTFSTFSFETFQLMRDGNYLIAIANVVVSIGLCLLVVALVSR